MRNTTSPRLPQGVPPEVVQQMLSRVMGEQGPPQSPPPPGQMPVPGQPAQQGQEPQQPAPPAEQQQEGLPPDVAEMLQGLLKDPKARDDIRKIVKAVGGDESKKSPLQVVDPITKMQLAQGWNARVVGLGSEIAGFRNPAPGSSKASDEALLRIYYTTPKGIELEDIDEYADAIRLDLVAKGATDVEKVEDQTMRFCFPLRELLIKSAGRTYQERCNFVREMAKLTERWIDKYGDLPKPDWKVVKATEAGKGDPESKIRDEDSSDLPGEV